MPDAFQNLPMKPVEWLTKYGNKLDEGEKRYIFAQEFIQEFDRSVSEAHGYSNLRGYEQAIRVLRAKWDAIGMRRGSSLDERLWKWIYASYIAPTREEAFPKEMEQRRKEKEERRQWSAWNKGWSESFFGPHFFDHEFEREVLKEDISLKEACNTLNISTEASLAELSRARRIAALKHHPDIGGSTEAMVAINVAYDTCYKAFSERVA